MLNSSLPCRAVALKPRVMQKSYGGNYDRKAVLPNCANCVKRLPMKENIPPYVVFNDATLIEM